MKENLQKALAWLFYKTPYPKEASPTILLFRILRKNRPSVYYCVEGIKQGIFVAKRIKRICVY